MRSHIIWHAHLFLKDILFVIKLLFFSVFLFIKFMQLLYNKKGINILVTLNHYDRLWNFLLNKIIFHKTLKTKYCHINKFHRFLIHIIFQNTLVWVIKHWNLFVNEEQNIWTTCKHDLLFVYVHFFLWCKLLQWKHWNWKMYDLLFLW